MLFHGLVLIFTCLIQDNQSKEVYYEKVICHFVSGIFVFVV